MWDNKSYDMDLMYLIQQQHWKYSLNIQFKALLWSPFYFTSIINQVFLNKKNVSTNCLTV